MTRFKYEESDNYAGGSSIFFNLKDDRDKATVRFLLNDLDDIEGVSCHELKVNDKRIDVECIRSYDEPVEKCPLCAAGYKPSAKLYIPLYNVDAKASQIWVRGRKFFDRLSGLCSRNNPLVGTEFEIERNGKSGDTSTTYEIYGGNKDNKRVEDFPEIIAEGNAFETYDYRELENFVRTGNFGDKNNNSKETRSNERQVPVRRRPSNYNEEDIY